MTTVHVGAGCHSAYSRMQPSLLSWRLCGVITHRAYLSSAAAKFCHQGCPCNGEQQVMASLPPLLRWPATCCSLRGVTQLPLQPGTISSLQLNSRRCQPSPAATWVEDPKGTFGRVKKLMSNPWWPAVPMSH